MATQQKTPTLSKLLKTLAKPPKPKKLIALQKALSKQADRKQLKPKMHAVDEFTEATALGMTDKFPFGKYKGKTLRHIVKTDPMWLSWILGNTDGKIRVSAAIQKEMAAFTAADAASLQAELDGAIEGDQVMLEEYGGDGTELSDTY